MEPGEVQTQTDFFMKLEAKQILRMDHQAVFSVLSLRSHWRSAKCAVNVGGWKPYVAKSGYRDADKLEKLGCVDAAALVNCKGAQKMEEPKVMTVTELQLKAFLLQEKKQARHLERAELKRLFRAGENGES